MRTIGIRGAGLSGLSVAQELLRADPNVSIALYDIRPRLPHPRRTFCFFQQSGVEGEGMHAFAWNTVMFRGAAFERRIDVSSSPYMMVRGDDFFEGALQELEAGGVSFHFGCKEVVREGNSLRVDGEHKAFDCVIDAAFDPTQATSLMWQSFAGLWIATERPVFDPSTAILMDLQGSSPEAPVSFLYVLPTSPNTALIEHTTFSLSPLPEKYHLDRCFAWVRERALGEFKVQEYERGAIPMGLRRPCVEGGVMVGSNAGAVRPATGYAFLAAREQAVRVCQSLLGGKQTRRSIYPRWLEFADRLFLYALVQRPEKGEVLMERLLSRSRADALISFLSGNVTVLEALSVWFSAPKLTMIRSLLRV